MPIITIDGNIGCGKSTILNYLHKFQKIAIDLEPVESWNNYLAKFYDEKADIFKFQVRVWLDRCWVQEKSDKTTILMERSPYFIKNTFVDVAFNSGMLNENEYSTLKELYQKTDSLWSCNTYIYMRSAPEHCMRRIKKRNRSSEKNITPEYIYLLHNKHEDTYSKAVENKMNIIVIDVDDKTVSDIANEIMQYLEYIHK